MADVCQDNDISLQNHGGGTSLEVNVNLQQSQDLQQLTYREQCQKMDSDASHGQDSGSSLNQNAKQNINICVVALPDSPTAKTNEQDVSVELQGSSSIAYGQKTDANSTNILPPLYNSAILHLLSSITFFLIIYVARSQVGLS